MPVPPRPTARRARLLAALACLPLATACGAGVPFALGPTPAAARARSDEFFGALAARFDRVQRTPRWEAARDKLGRFAMTPSRILGDTSVWTASSGPTVRYLELQAGPAGGHYEFATRAAAPAPTRPGEARHVIRLARTSDGVYQWNTQVEHAVGRMRAGDVATVTTAALMRLEQPTALARAELRATLPRTAAALGRLVDLDNLTTTSLGDGSTRVELRAVLHPGRLGTTMPAFAAFVRKYVSSSRLTVQVGDGGSARWLDVRAARDTVVVRLRLHDGRLLALDGPARLLPRDTELRTSAVTRYAIFDVGAANLVGDLRTVHAAHERGWQVRWRRAPEWRIPLGMRHLINGSLNRPFAGDGMQMAVTLREVDGGQTLLARRFDVAVQESAIVRWFGGLGSKAMSDLNGHAEAEQDRFTAEVLRAVAADVAAALARGPGAGVPAGD